MPLQLTPLKFETIPEILNGVIALKVNKELHKAFMDCMDSPELKNGREISLKITLKPRMRDAPMGGRSEFIGCDVTFGVSGRTPTQSIEVAMTQSAQGLLFNPDVPENPHQMTLPDDEET